MVQGLIHSLLRDDPDNQRFLSRCCFYVLPMAAKDGVVRGHTRFNLQGIDLNRGWNHPADPRLAPENHALEGWLATQARQERLPHLVIDLHNDNGGRLHVGGPHAFEGDRMRRLEDLLRRHTWFTEGSTSPSIQNSGTIGEGLRARFGIETCILELNADWIAGKSKVPLFGQRDGLMNSQRKSRCVHVGKRHCPDHQNRNQNQTARNKPPPGQHRAGVLSVTT